MINVTSTNEGWRVKLYELDRDGAWADQGTGFAECTMVVTAEMRAPMLIVRSEVVANASDVDIACKNESVVLIQSKIQCDDVYERQGGKWDKCDLSEYHISALSEYYHVERDWRHTLRYQLSRSCRLSRHMVSTVQ